MHSPTRKPEILGRAAAVCPRGVATTAGSLHEDMSRCSASLWAIAGRSESPDLLRPSLLSLLQNVVAGLQNHGAGVSRPGNPSLVARDHEPIQTTPVIMLTDRGRVPSALLNWTVVDEGTLSGTWRTNVGLATVPPREGGRPGHASPRTGLVSCPPCPRRVHCDPYIAGAISSSHRRGPLSRTPSDRPETFSDLMSKMSVPAIGPRRRNARTCLTRAVVTLSVRPDLYWGFRSIGCRWVQPGGNKGKAIQNMRSRILSRGALAVAALLSVAGIAGGAGALSFAETAGAASSTATLTVSPSTGLQAQGTTTVTVTGAGYAANSVGAILECNTDTSQPTVSLEGNATPVSCGPPPLATGATNLQPTNASGGFSASFTVTTGTVGPPATGTDSAGNDAAADAAKYPCPPTAADRRLASRA